MKKILLPALVCIATIGFTYKSHSQTGVTKLGTNALANNTTNGIYNTALGYQSLRENTTGNKNTGSGANTLRFNTKGIYNTATGYAALYHNTTGSSNTASGYYSLFTNTTGFSNTASGTYSLQENTTGSANTANGYNSLSKNTTGYSNTAIGYFSLNINTTGYYNSAIGDISLGLNTAGFRNTAHGRGALYNNTTGSSNTASGYFSLGLNTTGSNNSAIGDQALYQNTTGSRNTALGCNANVSTGNLTNATAIGYGAVANASNKVRIGNSSVTSIGGQVGWTIFSDGRYKENIEENVQGLAFINSLRPITYTINAKGLNEYFNNEIRKVISDNTLNEPNEAYNTGLQKAEDAASKIVYNGFVAQEVEEAAKKLNYEFSGVDRPENKEDLYGLRYDNFIVPVVKAVQELSGENEKLKSENEILVSKYEVLQKQVDELKAIVALLKSSSSQPTLNGHPSAFLDQNNPNPFHNSTVINYTLPERYSSAKIVITDAGGKVLKEATVFGSGKGSLKVDASLLVAGAYTYSLYLDTKLIDTKRMIATK